MISYKRSDQVTTIDRMNKTIDIEFIVDAILWVAMVTWLTLQLILK